MIKGTTTSGFEYEIDENVYDDWDFIDYLLKIDEDPNNTVYIINIAKIILGDEQLTKLKNHVRKDNKVKFSDMTVEIMDILNSNKVKN